MSANPVDQNDALEFTMLGNGLDFVLKALEEFQGDPAPRNLKYAVLHLKAGTDLVLKERLWREDWKQLFLDPIDADEKRFADGAFISPGTKELLRRLRDEVGVTVRSRDRRMLGRLRLLRNRLEHFTARDASAPVIAITAKALAFTLDFVGREIEPDGLDDATAAQLDSIRQRLTEVAAFVDERWAAIRGELAQYDAVIDCYRCGEAAFAVGSGARCHFCGYQVDAEAGAAEYAWLVLGSTEYDRADGGEWAVSHCPECGIETLLDTGIVGAETAATRWVCFNCGSAWNDDGLSSCTSCGALHSGEMDICPDCWDYKISRD